MGNKDIVFCSVSNRVLFARDAMYDRDGRPYSPECAPVDAKPFIEAVDAGWLQRRPPEGAAGGTVNTQEAPDWTDVPPEVPSVATSGRTKADRARQTSDTAGDIPQGEKADSGPVVAPGRR